MRATRGPGMAAHHIAPTEARIGLEEAKIKELLVMEILRQLSESDAELVSPDDLRFVLIEAATPDEIRAIAERLGSHEEDGHVQAVSDLQALSRRFTEDQISVIRTGLSDMARDARYRDPAAKLVGMDIARRLDGVGPRELQAIANEIRSDAKESAIDELLRIAGESAPGVVGSETYAQFTPGAEKQLVDLLSDRECLRCVDGLLKEYGRAGSREERTRLARKIMIGLWADAGFKEPAEELVEIAQRFEKILDLVVARGHFVHQLETFLLGCVVLGELSARMPDRSVFGSSDKELALTWLMTSSLHDIGYPLEQGKKIAEELCRMYTDIGMKQYADLYKFVDIRYGSISELEDIPLEADRPIHTYLNIPDLILAQVAKGVSADPSEIGKVIRRKWGSQDHGLIGAAILWTRLIRSGRVHPDDVGTTLEKSAAEQASTAIALHNFRTEDMTFSLELGRLPYAFLLVLMDELQEWHRTLEPYDGGKAAFELAGVEINSGTGKGGRDLIELQFDATDVEGESYELRKQIARKRHKLSSLVPIQVPAGTRELEIHAHFNGLGQNSELIDVLLLHRGDELS